MEGTSAAYLNSHPDRFTVPSHIIPLKKGIRVLPFSRLLGSSVSESKVVCRKKPKDVVNISTQELEAIDQTHNCVASSKVDVEEFAEVYVNKLEWVVS